MAINASSDAYIACIEKKKCDGAEVEAQRRVSQQEQSQGQNEGNVHSRVKRARGERMQKKKCSTQPGLEPGIFTTGK